MRTHDTDARKYRPTRTRRRPPDADAAASRRQRPADDETRTRLAPAAAAGPGRGTRHSSFDTTNKTGAHAAAWHALEPGATCSLPASLPHYDEPKLGPFTATTKDVPDATLQRAALCQLSTLGRSPWRVS